MHGWRLHACARFFSALYPGLRVDAGVADHGPRSTSEARSGASDTSTKVLYTDLIPGHANRRCSRQRQCVWKSRVCRRSCTALSHVTLSIKGGVLVCLHTTTSPPTFSHKPSLQPSHSPSPNIPHTHSHLNDMTFNGNTTALNLASSSIKPWLRGASEDNFPFLWQPASPAKPQRVSPRVIFGVCVRAVVLILHCRNSSHRTSISSTYPSTTTHQSAPPNPTWRSSAPPPLLSQVSPRTTAGSS